MHWGVPVLLFTIIYLLEELAVNLFLRIEDTDSKRYVEGAEKELIEGMRWLGLEWDEGVEWGDLMAHIANQNVKRSI